MSCFSMSDFLQTFPLRNNSCDRLDVTQFYTLSRSAWPQTKLDVHDIDPTTPDAVGSPNLYFDWRTSSSTPFFGFNGTRTLLTLLPNQQFDSVDTTFQKTIIPELKNKGFALDLNNTVDAFESDTVVLKESFYGFTKGPQKFTVQISTDQDNIDLFVRCGTVDPAYLTTYLQIEQAKKHQPDQRVEIWDITDNVATVNVGNIIGFGSGEYWNLTEQPPELLHTGQDHLACKLLESRKIGKGIECWDPGADNTRPAKY